jgi:CheY-like chemotaxis protein
LIEKQTAVISTAAETALPGGNEKILFIDDEPMLVDVCKLFLEELGYDVFAQTDPVKAIEIFRKDKDSFDLVITDKTMPHMTGFDLSREIKSIRADMAIILCSGFQEKQDFENISVLGIRRFITKPIVMRTLAETIRNVLDKKTP